VTRLTIPRRSNGARTKRGAAALKWTATTTRPDAKADDCPEIDQPQRDRAGIAARDNRCQQFPEARIVPRPRRIRANPEAAIEDTQRIRVEQRSTDPEGDHKHGVRDIRPHSGQRQQLLRTVRHTPGEPFAQQTAKARQAGASMREPQRPQELDHITDLGARQRGGVRVPAHERIERSRHQIGTRPLQKKFRDQYRVGIASRTPGKATTLQRPPFAHPPAKPAHLVRGERVRPHSVHGAHAPLSRKRSSSQ
jgi:hypothetical protein